MSLAILVASVSAISPHTIASVPRLPTAFNLRAFGASFANQGMERAGWRNFIHRTWPDLKRPITSISLSPGSPLPLYRFKTHLPYYMEKLVRFSSAQIENCHGRPARKWWCDRYTLGDRQGEQHIAKKYITSELLQY